MTGVAVGGGCAPGMGDPERVTDPPGGGGGPSGGGGGRPFDFGFGGGLIAPVPANP